LKILQIFSRYGEYGGEEGSVYRIRDTIRKAHTVDTFYASTSEWVTKNKGRPIHALRESLSNPAVDKSLELTQKENKYDFWLVHNVFPALSPSVYSSAFRLGVPVVHYLHSYRHFCVNGFFLNHGTPCTKCAGGNFLLAFLTKCWRNSRIQSGVMGCVLARTQSMGIFEKVAAWIAISHRQKEIYAQWGVPADRIHVAHHFYNAASPPPAFSTSPRALFIGRLSPEKGVDHLLQAWAQVTTMGASLSIVGDGPERPRLEELTRQLSLKGVHFHGFLEKSAQADIWAKSMVTIVPSIWEEPFGMVVLESWARKRPVIAHQIGALPELLTEGVTGHLVPPNSPEHLARQIDFALQQPEHTQTMGQNGYNDLHTRFSEDVWTKRIDEILSGF